MPTERARFHPSVSLASLRWPSPIGYLANRRALQRLVDELEPTILHAHFASGYGTLGAGVRAHRTLLSVWGADVYDFPSRSSLHRRVLGRNLHSYDALTSTSHVMAAHTAEYWPDLAAQITVVPFGVDVDRFSPAVPPDEASPVGEASPVMRVGTCKALAPKYGIDVLLNAFAISRAESTALRWELLIAGDGPQLEELKAIARRLGIEDDVQFLGQIENTEVPRFLRRLDIFCALSIDDSESFGVAAVEAMATGLPTVVSDVDGFVEVTTTATSIVVPRHDPTAAAGALSQLAADSDRRRALGSAGRQRVLAEYNWRTNVDRMTEVYRRL